MPQGDKKEYTDKQKREAAHIEKGYEARGVSKEEAERRAWATVNKVHHGGEKPAAAASGQVAEESRAHAEGRTEGRVSVVASFR